MLRPGRRFNHHLDDNLVRLQKNLYISPGDPMYHEKVIRYLDAKSPESHFKLGQMYEKRGNVSKALFHYKEVLHTYPSPYYSAANRAVKQIEQRRNLEPPTDSRKEYSALSRRALIFLKTLLVVLLVINLLFLVMYFGGKSISSKVSEMKLWEVGTEITYETLDIPYVMYFSMDDTANEVEKALHDKALELSRQMPKQNIVLYGLAATDNSTQDQAIPLVNEALTEQAFVVAQYHAMSDTAVKIRFLNRDFLINKPLTALGANLVRTALQSYIRDHGEPPGNVNALLQNYPDNYLSFVPQETLTHSNSVAPHYDGSGGWVYNAAAGETSSMFYPNVPIDQNPSFEPLYILITKKDHRLRLLSGNYLVDEKQVGLGAGDQTPVGSFVVQDRVLSPIGQRANMFGSAGLGMGDLAIHGTYDAASIGSNQSMGCIRLPNEDAEDLLHWVPKGAQVLIQGNELGGIPPVRIQITGREALLPSEMPEIDQTPENVIFQWLG